MNQKPETRNQKPFSKRDKRQSRFAKINATWKQLRPDLRTAEDLRQGRLEFAEAVLGCGPIGSFSDLTIPELDRVIAAMVRGAQTTLPGVQSTDFSRVVPIARASQEHNPTEVGTLNTRSGEVIHLASDEEVWAIEQVLNYLGWTEDGRRGFFSKNFRRPSAHMLKPRQAKSAISILLSIAASRDIKQRAVGSGQSAVKVSRGMMRAEMPSLKARIGIGRRDRELKIEN